MEAAGIAPASQIPLEVVGAVRRIGREEMQLIIEQRDGIDTSKSGAVISCRHSPPPAADPRGGGCRRAPSRRACGHRGRRRLRRRRSGARQDRLLGFRPHVPEPDRRVGGGRREQLAVGRELDALDMALVPAKHGELGAGRHVPELHEPVHTARREDLAVGRKRASELPRRAP